MVCYLQKINIHKLFINILKMHWDEFIKLSSQGLKLFRMLNKIACLPSLILVLINLRASCQKFTMRKYFYIFVSFEDVK